MPRGLLNQTDRRVGFPRALVLRRMDPGLGWLHILSDLAVWAAYVTIPCVLGPGRDYSTRPPCWPPAGTTRRASAGYVTIAGPTPPDRLVEVREALRDRDLPRLRKQAHKLCGLLSTFSTAADEPASDLEEHAIEGRFDAARPLLDRLETMARNLMHKVNGLSLESLRRPARE